MSNPLTDAAMMMTPPSHQQLALLLDQELHDLAALWRNQASRGVRPAFGVAHALEVECRRRLRERGGQPLLPTHAQRERRWWHWR